MFYRYKSAEDQLKQDVHLGVLEGLLELLLLLLHSLAALANSCLLLLHPTSYSSQPIHNNNYAVQRCNQACIAKTSTEMYLDF